MNGNSLRINSVTKQSPNPPLPPFGKGGMGGFFEIATSPATLLGGLLAMTNVGI